MMIRQRRFLLGLLWAILVSAPVGADVVTLVTSKDNTLYESSTGSVSNGAGDYFFTGRTAAFGGTAIRRGLIAFDIAGNIPAGSTINTVQLRLHMSRTRFTTGRSTELHPALADWGEGTSNASFQEGRGAPATTGDATWLHTFFNTDFWVTAGGDFSLTISASQNVAGVTFYTWGSTAQMVGDVQGWLDSPATNFGWIMVGEESVSTTAKRFDTRENPTTANRPLLEIDFTPPLVVGACCDELTGICTDDIELGNCIAANERFGGDGSDCATLDPPCQPSGACCDDATGICTDLVLEADCQGGELRFGGNGSTCATIDPTCVPPPAIGACCDDLTGVCSEAVTEDDCALSDGRFGGDGSDCATIDPPCIPSGACCDDSDGFCVDGVLQADCEGVGLRYGGDASTCATIDPPCTPLPIGACCIEPNGICLESLTSLACSEAGGRFGGEPSTCANMDPACRPAISISLQIVARGAGTATAGIAPTLVAPLFLTHAGDGSGRLFIVDQVGLIRIVDAGGNLLATPFLDLSSKIVPLNPGCDNGDPTDLCFDERGLLGLAFHPQYAANGRFFVRYSAPRAGDPAEPCNDPKGFIVGCHEEILAQYSVSGGNPDVADPASEIILFRVDEPQFNHDAGQVAFGPDGLLYWTLGDGGGAHDGLADGDPPGSAPSHGPIGNGQNVNTVLGSLLRIDVGAGNVLPDDFPEDPNRNYAIPSSNPFALGGGAPEIYAYGFRNPYRFSFVDFTDGGNDLEAADGGNDFEIIVADVGQNLFEEINFVPGVPAPGLLNYGWVIKEGFSCFDPFDPLAPPATCDEVGPFGEPLLDPVVDYPHPTSCANADCVALGTFCKSDGFCANASGIAVIGGFIYRGTAYPALCDKYVFGDFGQSFITPSGRLFYMDVTGPGAFQIHEFFITPNGDPLGQALFGIGEDEDGELYVLASDNIGPEGDVGVVYRIQPPEPVVTDRLSPRYLEINVPPSPAPFALAITPDCPAGTTQYAGLPSGPHNLAELVGAPVALTSIGWGGPVRVSGVDITPSSGYLVQTDWGLSTLSPAATALTAIHGDVVGFFENGAYPPPDGIVNIVDVLAIVERFLNLETAPPIYRVDLIGLGQQGVDCAPDRLINIVDVGNAVDAFRGISYTDTTNGCLKPCP